MILSLRAQGTTRILEEYTHEDLLRNISYLYDRILLGIFFGNFSPELMLFRFRLYLYLDLRIAPLKVLE